MCVLGCNIYVVHTKGLQIKKYRVSLKYNFILLERALDYLPEITQKAMTPLFEQGRRGTPLLSYHLGLTDWAIFH